MVCLLVVAALGTVACSDDAGEEGASPSAHPGIGHVHGVGIEPASGDVLVAGHHGLVRLPADGGEATGAGTADHDFMGLTVAGPEHLLASGHPEPGSDLPDHLGLIESRDGGLAWQPVSLLGEADFHAMDAGGGGRTVAGYDSVGGRLMVSTDHGRTWTAQDVPQPLISLAVHPEGGEAIVVSTSEGLLRRDPSGGWAEADAAPALVAWDAPARLVRVGADGAVALSADAGATWRPTGSAPAPPVALAAADALIVVVDADGEVSASRDDGATWRTLGTVPM
jgi:photosystem II stability/assembly factor-like uncharacterized protein